MFMLSIRQRSDFVKRIPASVFCRENAATRRAFHGSTPSGLFFAAARKKIRAATDSCRAVC